MDMEQHHRGSGLLSYLRLQSISFGKRRERLTAELLASQESAIKEREYLTSFDSALQQISDHVTKQCRPGKRAGLANLYRRATLLKSVRKSTESRHRQIRENSRGLTAELSIVRASAKRYQEEYEARVRIAHRQEQERREQAQLQELLETCVGREVRKR